MSGRSPQSRYGLGLILLAAVAVSPWPAVASSLAEHAGVAQSPPRRQTIVILPTATVEVAAGANTSCSCGAFNCKGKDFPACSMTCVEPETAVCDCGFCERTMGSPKESPNSGALGPVANSCACH